MNRIQILFAALLLLALGCGGGGGGGNGVPTILKSDVQVLGANDPRQIVDVTSDTITISGDSSALGPGTVLVNGSGQGLLRHVDSVEPQGANTLLHTSQAALEDVFDSVGISKRLEIGRDQVASFTPAGPGISMDGGQSAQGRGHVAEIHLTLDHYTLSDEGAGTLSVSGTLTLLLDLDFDLRIGHGEDYVRCVFSLTGSADAQLEASLAKTFTLSKIHLGRITGEPLLFFAGIVPIVVVPELDLYSIVDGTTKIGANFTASASFTAQLGAAYDNGTFKLVTGLNHAMNLTPQPNFYGSVTASYAPAHAELSTLLYGVSGPYATVDAPRFDLTYLQQVNPAGKQVTASAVFEGLAGIKMQIFKHAVLDHEFPGAIHASFNFYGHFFPDSAGVGVGIR